VARVPRRPPDQPSGGRARAPELGGITGRYFDTNTKEQKLHKTAYDVEVKARVLALRLKGQWAPSFLRVVLLGRRGVLDVGCEKCGLRA
jgi:hypothetical protein